MIAAAEAWRIKWKEQNMCCILFYAATSGVLFLVLKTALAEDDDDADIRPKEGTKIKFKAEENIKSNLLRDLHSIWSQTAARAN